MLAAVSLQACYVFKAYTYRDFQLNDLEKLPAVELKPSAEPFAFAYDTASHLPLGRVLDSNLKNSLTYAFLVIRNDTILYERYFGAVEEQSKLPSFSVAKSVTSTLIGIALEEGLIESLDEPVTNYIPQLKKRKGFERVTIQHVLDMRSGVQSSEEYHNPFSDVLKMGFANNVSKPVYRAKTERSPGQFDYKSLNTQILALVLEGATGKKVQDYAYQKVWQPLHMEFPATWNADRQNTVRAFCCINAAARDFARFGRLFLHKGNWQGQQIVPASWVERSVSADTMRAYGGYKNQWWSQRRQKTFLDSLQAAAFLKTVPTPDGLLARGVGDSTYWRASWFDGSYYAHGILGQYVFVDPTKNLIIVRLGHNWSHRRFFATGFIQALADEL